MPKTAEGAGHPAPETGPGAHGLAEVFTATATVEPRAVQRGSHGRPLAAELLECGRPDRTGLLILF